MFETFDAWLLAPIQPAFTVSFHFLFPAITIGLTSYPAVLEGLWLKTEKPAYMDLARYGVKILAIVFATGVVSENVMSYQFGTNWLVFSDKAGPIIGPLTAHEVLTAVFSGARLSGCHAVRDEQGGKESALHGHADGGARHLHFRLLDPVREQLDAPTDRLHSPLDEIRGQVTSQKEAKYKTL